MLPARLCPCRSRSRTPRRASPESWPANRYIAYFQAYTNTHAPAEYLRPIFLEAITRPEVAVLSIATRPDCLEPEILELLGELNRIKPVWVELGLQTIHEDTARFIRRGYPLAVFERAMEELHARGIETVVHVILGLPGETPERMLDTVRFVSASTASGIKLQLLHVLKGTDLASYYENPGFSVLSEEAYVGSGHPLPGGVPSGSGDFTGSPGDGPKDLLMAPLWSQAKRQVLNHIHRELKIRDTFQGRLWEPAGREI